MMEETISLKEIFDIIRKRLPTILIITFIGLVIAGVFTFFIVRPQYRSRAQLIVSLPQSETTSVNDIDFNLQMLNTYKDIILRGDAQALEVQKRLANNYQLELSPTEIISSLQVVQTENSQLFSIEATSENASTAAAIANVTAEVFQETVKDILTTVDTVTIVSSAATSTNPVSPNNVLNLAIGLVSGIMFGVGLAILSELFDRTVKDQKYVTNNLGLTLLGSVPFMTVNNLNVNEDCVVENQPMDETNNIKQSGRKKG